MSSITIKFFVLNNLSQDPAIHRALYLRGGGGGGGRATLKTFLSFRMLVHVVVNPLCF
jgi:hypothetical protein